jgi:hypothetical protein
MNRTDATEERGESREQELERLKYVARSSIEWWRLRPESERGMEAPREVHLAHGFLKFAASSARSETALPVCKICGAQHGKIADVEYDCPHHPSLPSAIAPLEYINSLQRIQAETPKCAKKPWLWPSLADAKADYTLAELWECGDGVIGTLDRELAARSATAAPEYERIGRLVIEGNYTGLFMDEASHNRPMGDHIIYIRSVDRTSHG